MTILVYGQLEWLLVATGRCLTVPEQRQSRGGRWSLWQPKKADRVGEWEQNLVQTVSMRALWKGNFGTTVPVAIILCMYLNEAVFPPPTLHGPVVSKCMRIVYDSTQDHSILQISQQHFVNKTDEITVWSMSAAICHSQTCTTMLKRERNGETAAK